MPPQQLEDSLTRLETAELLYRRGTPPDAEYTFKHALVQNTAYGSLLRSKRQQLHAHIAATLESQFPETVVVQPELLAHHYTKAGAIERAAALWATAGQRSLERSALIEAIAQLTRALDQIAALPPTPALRREQINFQVALITPLVHVKGYAASETRAAVERAHVLIEQAQALGEPPDDPLLLFSVLYGFWAANINGDVARELATQFLTLAEKGRMTAVQPHAHHFMGVSLLETGGSAGGRAHFDRAIALYDPAQHRLLATRFGRDARVSALSRRSPALWFLGYPDAALADAERALSDAREFGQAATPLMALWFTSWTLTFCGNYVAANAQVDEMIALADEKGTGFWKVIGMVNRGWLFAETGRTADAVQMNSSGLAAVRSTGATLSVPIILTNLAKVHAELGHFDEAWRCVGEALTEVQATKVTLFEAELNRVAGNIVLRSPEPDPSKAQGCFERALAVARQQQAKSWELRAAMSMARLWRDQGKRDEARDLLAPIYGWFTQGFDTLDLKEAKALLDELAA
jgi:predicted ATPase